MAEKLTGRQRAFIDAYCGAARFNATEAARQAGYTGSAGVIRSVASENLTKPNISQEIQRRMAALAMPAHEVLTRLAEHGRASLKPFLRIDREGNPHLDLSSEEARQHLHLLKKIKTKKRTGGKDENAWEETEIEFELHDSQAALVHIGRHHKLFTDKHELAGTLEFAGLSDEELDKRIAALEQAAAEGARPAKPAADNQT